MAPAKLQFVMGKGGVGRTTVSAALALARAEAGERVVLASLASPEALRAALRAGWGEPPATLELVELDPRRLVDEVLGKLMPIPQLAVLVTGHPAYEAVYSIAPGVKELAILHRLGALAGEGRDSVVVDAFATGHGAHFLEAPRKSVGLLSGRLAERARELDALLTDPARASVLLVTTLEEMPVRETAELAALLRREGFHPAAVVANRVVDRLFPSPLAVEALERLATRGEASQVGSEIGASWGMVQRLTRAALHLERRAREMEPHLQELRGLGLPLAAVPLIPGEEGRLRAVAARLGEAVP